MRKDEHQSHHCAGPLPYCEVPILGELAEVRVAHDQAAREDLSGKDRAVRSRCFSQSVNHLHKFISDAVTATRRVGGSNLLARGLENDLRASHTTCFQVDDTPDRVSDGMLSDEDLEEESDCDELEVGYEGRTMGCVLQRLLRAVENWIA